MTQLGKQTRNRNTLGVIIRTILRRLHIDHLAGERIGIGTHDIATFCDTLKIIDLAVLGELDVRNGRACALFEHRNDTGKRHDVTAPCVVAVVILINAHLCFGDGQRVLRLVVIRLCLRKKRRSHDKGRADTGNF